MKMLENEICLHIVKPNVKLNVIYFFMHCMRHAFVAALFATVIFFTIDTLFHPNIDTVSLIRILITFCFVLFNLVLIISYVYHRFLIKTMTYYVTNKRCIWKGGILRKSEHSVPLSKITDLERSQNIIEQILDISTINIFTPGTASYSINGRARAIPELRFEGLSQSEDIAATINENLRSLNDNLL